MIEVGETGIEAVRRALGLLGKVAAAPDVMLAGKARLADILVEGPGGKGEAAAGQDWAPLSEETISRRRTGKRKGGPQILQDSNKLKQSIVSIVHGGEVTVGTGVEYGKWHQGGTTNMPARPFVGIDEVDRETFVKVVLRHMEAAFRA